MSKLDIDVKNHYAELGVLIAVIILFIQFSCAAPHEQKVIIQMDSIPFEISIDTKLFNMESNAQIGKIVSIKDFNGSLYAEGLLMDNVKIPVGSQFFATIGLFGVSDVFVAFSDSELFLEGEDTVFCLLKSQSEIELDSSSLDSFAKSIKDARKYLR